MNDKNYITQREIERYEKIVENYKNGNAELTKKVEDYLGYMLCDIVFRSPTEALDRSEIKNLISMIGNLGVKAERGKSMNFFKGETK